MEELPAEVDRWTAVNPMARILTSIVESRSRVDGARVWRGIDTGALRSLDWC